MEGYNYCEADHGHIYAEAEVGEECWLVGVSPSLHRNGGERYTPFICTVISRIAVYVVEEQWAEQRKRAEDGFAKRSASCQPHPLVWGRIVGFHERGTYSLRTA